MIFIWRWVFFISSLFLSFIYWFNLCRLNLYLRAPELTLPHSENSAFNQSKFSVIQWVVPQPSARIIRASGCFSECFHFGCFVYCDVFCLRINSDGIPGTLLWQIYLQILSYQLSENQYFWLEILPLMSQAFSVSVISQFIASCKSARCHNAKTRLFHLNSCAGFRMSIVESYQLLSSRNC